MTAARVAMATAAGRMRASSAARVAMAADWDRASSELHATVAIRGVAFSGNDCCDIMLPSVDEEDGSEPAPSRPSAFVKGRVMAPSMPHAAQLRSGGVTVTYEPLG